MKKARSKSKSRTKNPHWGSTLDEFLEEEGTREAFQAIAIKEVLAWQLEKAMKAKGLSRNRLAKEMGTSRSQISRLLDPNDGNVTLVTLQRAAEMLGRKVRFELV
jgi:antitoxin HicB